jgi:hypothetical protein
MPDLSNLYTSPGSYQTFVPSSLIQAITGVVFYAALLIVAIMSLFTIYSLIKYSDSKPTAFTVTIIYLVIFFSMAAAGMYTLSLIK